MKNDSSISSIAISDIPIADTTKQNVQSKTPESKFSLFYSSILLSSSSIGISSLAYPSSMANSGIVLWVMLLILAVSINYISSYVLVFCGREMKAKSFSDLTEKMMGKWTIAIDLMCVILNIGIIISCIMTFNDFMTGIFQHQYFENISNVIVKSKKSLFWIIFPNLFLVPVLLRRRMSDMNFIGVGCVCSIALLAIFIIYVFAYQSSAVDFKQLEYFNISKSPSSLTMLIFGFMNQQSILDVFTELKRRKIDTVNKILNYQNITSSILYCVIAGFGYLTFYKDPDVFSKNLFAFDLEKNCFYMIINSIVGLSVLLSIVPTFRPTKNIIIGYLKPNGSGNSSKSNFFVTVALQTILVVSACCFESFDVNFIDVIDFMSIFVSPTICIYLPLIYYVRVSKSYRFLLLILLVFIANIFAIISF
jgi:amino acid permease